MIGSVYSWCATSPELKKSGVSNESDHLGGYLRLSRNASGFVTNGTVKTPIVTVLALKRWLGIDATEKHFRDPEDPVNFLTRISYRIEINDAPLWFDGADWVAAGDNDWNTQPEIFDAIVLLTSDVVRIVARLETDSITVSPRLREIRLAFELAEDYELMDDLIRNGLLPMLREIRGIGRVRLESDGEPIVVWSNLVSKFDTSYQQPTPTGAWNHSLDPRHRRNIMLSFAADEVELDPVPAVDEFVEIAFSYVPVVAHTTSTEYYSAGRDIGQVPAITVENIERSSGVRMTGMSDFVVRRDSDPLAYVVPAYRTIDIAFKIHIATDKDFDRTKLIEALTRRLANVPKVTAPGCGFSFLLNVGDVTDAGFIDLNGLYEASVEVRILNVALFDREIEAKHAVKKLMVETSGDIAPNTKQLDFKVEQDA